jgi:hypothetical protein
LLDRSLLDIRQEFNLLPFIKGERNSDEHEQGGSTQTSSR